MSAEILDQPAPTKPQGNPFKREFQVTNEFLQKYTVKRQGQDVVLVKGLMHLAHEFGFRGVKTRFTQVATAETNWTAYAETEVVDEFGRVFVEGGDANDMNVGSGVKAHFPRMALTRSKGRALRDALGLQLLVDEELEVMIDVSRGSNNGATPDQFNEIKTLREAKGKARDWLVNLAAKLFEKGPAELNANEADVIIMLLDELPNAPVPVA